MIFLSFNLFPSENAIQKEQNLSVVIYETIKDKIIVGDLAPNTMLLERAIAVDFGVSRTPVREALKRLSLDGLILWEERRRAVVSDISEKDVVELFLMREMIEPFAIKKIIEHGEPELLAGILVPIVKEMENLKNSHVELMKQDMVFHSTIINYLGINKLSQMWQKISDEMTRVAIYALHAKRQPDTIIEEHKMLIDAFWHCELESALYCINGHHSNITADYKAKHDFKKNNDS